MVRLIGVVAGFRAVALAAARLFPDGDGDGGAEGAQGDAAGDSDASQEGDASEDTSAELEALRAAVETATARATTLEGQLTAADGGRRAADDRVAELEAQLAAEQEARSTAESRGLDAHRRALVAAHAGEIVDELVQGTTEEALEASVGVAKAAYDRIRDLVTTGQTVPPGATERGTGDLDGLSPLEKIARGLTK